MNIINIKLSDLKPYERNPRNNKEAVDYVANSIREFGFKNPIIVDKNNVIVAGHTRYLACKKLGIKEVPCVIADDLTDEQIKAFRLADNKVAEIATWDLDLLDEELNDLLKDRYIKENPNIDKYCIDNVTMFRGLFMNEYEVHSDCKE